MILIITGAPGAGKGTISEIIEQDIGLVHISAGDMLRDHIHKKDELGLKIKDFIEKGMLISDELVEEIIHERISKDDIKEKGVLIDGFPRTLGQAKDLIKTVKIDGLIEVFLEEENIISRLSQRRVCLNCGHSFHLEYKKPKVENICDNCGEKLVHRKDDTPEIIKDRLITYHKETAPIIDFFKDNEIQYLQLRGDLNINTQREFIVNQIKGINKKY